MAYTVKAVADIAGISVRALHHYDAIGLLKPADLSAAGYRLYSRADLERLQQILLFRELGFALGDIREVIERPGFDRDQALRKHRQLLVERRDRLTALIESVDRTLTTMERGGTMDEKSMFDGFDQSRYEEEARQRWGRTDAYKESTRRAKLYTKDDWTAIKAEWGAIESGLAALMDGSPADPAVQTLVERHRRLITDRFYDCTLEIYRGLAEMYVADDRFAAHYEAIRPGMAGFMRAAMLAYCDEAEK